MRFRFAAGKEEGLVFLGALFMVILMGLALSATGSAWNSMKQRDNEEELIFRGAEISRAIARYYNESPGGAKLFPKKLEDLVDDKRFPVVKRHLRRLYDDPMTGKADWVLIKSPDGSIMGVKSAFGGVPFKTDGFPFEMDVSENAESYSDWEFRFDPAKSGAVLKRPNKAP